MTTALFLLRCVEIGISISDLDLLTIGMVLDVWTEKGNDSVTYDSIAGQREFDLFESRKHFTFALKKYNIISVKVK